MLRGERFSEYRIRTNRRLFTPSRHSRVTTRVRILFSIPAVRRMVGSPQGMWMCLKRQGSDYTWAHMRTVLPHAPVLVQASAREARANGRGRGLGGPPQERLPLHGRRGPTRPSTLWLGEGRSESSTARQIPFASRSTMF